jgi:hypothetical protein
MQHQDRTVDRKIGRIAAGQHGNVTRVQLLAEDITKEEIRWRLMKGSLLPEFPGVYRVGHRAPSIEARYMAAVLACGEGALLSGRAAAHHLGLLKGRPPPPEVTAPTERRIKGIQTHRARRGEQRDATTWRGIPITTPARTLVDLAAVVSEDHLARAAHEAGIKHGTTPAQVEAVLDTKPTANGARKLRKILHGDAHVTLSALERRFLGRLTDAGLPTPDTNKRAGGRRVDCRWPGHNLTVELDGYRYHRSRHAWELDRRREREARERGDEFRRFTYHDVYESPRYMLSELGGLLRRSRELR